MTTITEVALRAGVSMKTVSRVLNGEPHVRAEKIERVEKAVRDLGYRPNLAARQLAGKRSHILVFLFNQVSATYIMSVLSAAAASCRGNGFHLVSEPVESSADASRMIDDIVQLLRPDGFILSPPLSDDAALLSSIAATGIPVARIAGTVEATGIVVSIDDSAVSQEMTAHLIELGHRRIGFVTTGPQHRVAQGRVSGFRTAMAEAGIAVDEDLIATGDFSYVSGERAGHALLDRPSPPTAVFAANDAMALGVMSAATILNRRIPEDVAVCGFDDSPISRMIWPPLTTVRQPIGEMTAVAVARLIGNPDPTEKIGHQLLLRRSTTGQGGIVDTAIDA